MNARRDRAPGGRHGAVWDLVVAGLVVAVLFVVGVALGVYESTLDTLSAQPATAEILALSFLSLGAAAFVAARRVGQARRERSLRGEVEARFRTIVERVPAISYVWDGEVEPGAGPARYISPQIEAMLGYTAEVWLAEPDRWADAIHPDDLAPTLEAWRQAVAATDGFTAEYRIRDAGGSWHWVRDEAMPVSRDAGSLYQGVIVDITERREAEERIRTMLQRLPVVAFTTDYEPATGVVHDRWIAPGIERLVGVADESWLAESDPWVARAHPGDVDRVLGAWREMARSGGTFAEEYRLRRADGTWVWVREETSAVLRDGRLRCDGVFIDISAQRAAETAHTDAEERFKTLVEQLPAVTYIEEPSTGRNLYISPQIEAIYGVAPAAWLADPHLWETRLHPEDRERVLAENRDIEGDEWDSEYRSIDRDGRTIWLHNAARLVRDPDGAPRFWLGIVSDVTERKDAEQHLRAAEERYRHLVEQMPVAVYTDAVDELSTAVYISPRYEELTGYTPDERLADPGLWAAILHPEDRERVLTESERTNVTGDPFDMEYRVVRKDGGTAWLHDHASLVTGPDGVPIWQGVLQDVTAQRAAADALARRDAILEATGFAAARFLAAESWLEVLDEVLARLGAAAGAGRAYVDTTSITEDDVEVTPLRSWGPDLGDAAAFGMHAAGLGRWAEELGAGRPVHGAVAELPEGERVIFELSSAPVGSILVVPITVDGQWWGSIGLDDPDPARTWHDGEVDALATTANALGGAIAREQAARRYRTLIEQIPAVTYIEDATTGLETYVSPQITAMLGYTPEEWRAADVWMAAVHPEDREWVLAEDDRVTEAGEVFRAEYRLLTKDGQTRWVREEAVPVADDRSGAITLWQGVRFDITQEKEAEERLRAAEERYRLVVEQLPAIAYVDERRDVAGSRTWPCVYVSPQVETILGFTPEEWVTGPETWDDLIHPDDLERAAEADTRHYELGEAVDVEIRIKARDGEYRWIRDQAVIVYDDEGEPRWSQGIWLDVTERKLAELALEEAEHRYRGIVEHVPAAIYLDKVDASMESVYVSPQIETIVGVSPERWMAEPDLWLRLTDGEDRDRVEASYLQAAEAKRPWSAEYRMHTPDGRTIWVHDETTFLIGPDGEPRYMQGVIFDITERKLAEQALRESEQREREAAERLRSLDEMKNTFLAAVSHELRSPLTSILGLSITLERAQAIPDEDRADLLGRLAGNARKLDRLLKDLLDIDRLNRGIVEPQLRMTDVGALARRTVENLDALAGREVAVRTDAVMLAVDPPKVERIVENLLVNAGRHTEAGRRIWLDVAPSDAGVLIRVEDDGPGVPDEMRAVIFEPFRQGPTATSHAPGTGVGLSLVARFAELHGGRAWVEPREGGGASFRVYIPGGPAEGADATPAAAAAG